MLQVDCLLVCAYSHNGYTFRSDICWDQVSVGMAIGQEGLASMAVCATLQSETQEAEGVVNIDTGGSQS